MTQAEILERIEKAVTGLTNPGGLMETQDADRFIDLVIDESVLLKRVTTQRMNNSKKNVQTFGISGIVTAPKSSGNLVDQSSKITTAKRVLSTTTLGSYFEIDDDFLEDNIEKDNFDDLVMRGVAKQTASDLENLALNGGTSGSFSADETTLYATTTGWVQYAATEGHVVDGLGGTITSSIYRDAFKAMPAKYANPRDLVWVVSHLIDEDYRSILSTQGSNDAFSMLMTDKAITPRGVEQIRASLLQTNLSGYVVGGGSAVPSSTVLLLTNPQNLVWGIERKVQFETDRDIKAGLTQIAVTTRVDAQIANPDALVAVVNLTTS